MWKRGLRWSPPPDSTTECWRTSPALTNPSETDSKRSTCSANTCGDHTGVRMANGRTDKGSASRLQHPTWNTGARKRGSNPQPSPQAQGLRRRACGGGQPARFKPPQQDHTISMTAPPNVNPPPNAVSPRASPLLRSPISLARQMGMVLDEVLPYSRMLL